MRDNTQTSYIIPLAAILLALVLAMMLTESRFFEMTKEQRYAELDNGWHRIELGYFSLNTPNAFKYYEQDGIDSFVGLLTDGSDSLMFDFGWYSDSLPAYIRTTETINGRVAHIGFSDTLGSAIHFPNIGNNNRLTIHSGAMSKELALDIFRSIKIPD